MTASLNQIERACAELARDGRTITITAVAQRVGIARSTIYRNLAFRTMIEHHRQTAPGGPITAITDELATLRVTIQALADTVRQHDAKIRFLARE